MEALAFFALVVPFLLMVYFACLLFIRPPRKVFWASLLGGLLVGIINLVGDLIAYQVHSWRYVFASVSIQRNASALQKLIADLFAQSLAALHIPLPFYLTPILIFGSLAFLLIWRFWYGRGRWFALLLLIGTPIFCIVRDSLGGLQKTSYQVWENAPLALGITIAMWLVAFYLGLWIFWRLSVGARYVRPGDDAVEGRREPEAEVKA